MLDHRLLTAYEEIELAQRIEAGRDAAARLLAGEPDETSLLALVEAGCAAREELILCNIRLVHGIAHHYDSRDRALSRDDLIQQGMVGLIIAVDKYDWRRGNRFSTHAHWWVMQAIARAVETSGTISKPANHKQRMKPRTQAALERANRIYDIDEPYKEKGGYGNRTPAEIIPDPDDNTEDRALDNILVAQALSVRLPKGWHGVVRDWMNGCTYRDAGELNGFSRGVTTQALLRIKAHMHRHIE